MRKFRQTLLPDHDGTRKLIHQMECRTGPYKIETSLMVPPTMYTAFQFVKKESIARKAVAHEANFFFVK